MNVKIKNAFHLLLGLALCISLAASISTRIRGDGRDEGHDHEPNRNVTELLNSLLVGYDNSIRPDYGGPPTIVEIDIMVRSMGPISEVDMTYSMDCYFRQSWLDDRLSYNDTNDSKGTLALSIAFERWIWKPDTAFYNGKQAYLHTITTPNKFVRLYQDGRVLYSSRLTIKASCPMHLKDFPMDTQRCPLKLGSFAYTTRDLIYRWNVQRQVVIAQDMKMSQFDLISTPCGNATEALKSGVYSFLMVSFHLQRHTGNFLIEVYGPVSLLVVLSWLSFWLNREATADRVSLGITIILTITFHFTPLSRTDLPKVPYPTALDFFIYLSFTFIFATIIQFAFVHWYTKKGSGEVIYADSASEDEMENEGSYDFGVRNRITPRPEMTSSSVIPHIQVPEDDVVVHPHHEQNDVNFINVVDTDTEPVSFGVMENPRRNSNWSFCRRQRKRRKVELESVNSVSQIDRLSRILFPLTYIAINMFYWYCYQSNIH